MMFLNATKEVQVTPYDRGKVGSYGNRHDGTDPADSFGRSHSAHSKSKLSIDQYHFLENKDNYRPEKKKDIRPKVERELTDAYIDTISRTPRYGLGRHKTYDEILLSMSTDDPFGQNYQPSAINSNKEKSTQNSNTPEKGYDKSSVKTNSKTKSKEGGALDKSLQQTDDSKKTKNENQPEGIHNKEIEKVPGNQKNVEKKSASMATSKIVSDKNITPTEKSTEKTIKSETPTREKKVVAKKSNKDTQKPKIKSAKKSQPKRSRIPVLSPNLLDSSQVSTNNEYKYRPVGTDQIKHSKIPVMKQLSLSDAEKRKTLSITNKRWLAKFKNSTRLSPGQAMFAGPRKSAEFAANSTFSHSPRRSTESHVFGSSLGSPWRRTGSAQGARNNHTFYPVEDATSQTGFMTDRYKSMTLNECDYKELKEITALAFGKKSKTMFDDYSMYRSKEAILTPKRDNFQPKLERELSDAYIDSISRTPRYGLGRHKTYDEILLSLSQADPFNGNYQPSGISPREKTNVSLKGSSDANNLSQTCVQSKNKG